MRPDGSVGGSTWRFGASAGPAGGREELARRGASLAACFRAAHGAGVRLAVDLVGGPETGLFLSTDEPVSTRWVDRSLASAHEVWSWHPSSRPPGAPVRWVGSRDGLPGEADAPPVGPGQLLRALSAAMRSGGPAERLSIVLAPAPSGALARAEIRNVPSGPRTGAGPPALGPDRRRPGPVGLAWFLSIELRSSREPPSVVAQAVAAAWTALDGRPLHWHRPRRWRGLLAPASRLLESELLGLVPVDGTEVDGGPSSSGEGGLPVGRTPFGSVVGLPVEPDQGRHFVVLGETGMGKSSLLVAGARRAARQGLLIVLDPLGETAAALRDELAADGREPRWIEPGAPAAGLNALREISVALPTDRVRAERELEDLVRALRRVRAARYADTPYWGPRLEEMLRRALRVAAHVEGGTIEDAHTLLATAGQGRSVVPPEALGEAQELAARVRARPDDGEGARRLLYEIARNPTLHRMLCARRPTLSMPELVRGDRPVLLSGAAARVGETTARYLLAAYLALLWSALLARPQATKTFVVLDEAQWFAHEGLAEMLRLARRRNVHVGLATQSLASLSEEVQEAVRTNVADLVAFRGSPADARELGRLVPGSSVDALSRLGRGEALALIGKGEVVRWLRTARSPGPCASGLAPVALSVDPESTGGDRPSVLESETRPEADPLEAPAPVDRWFASLRRAAEALPPGELLAFPLDPGSAGPAASEVRRLGGTLGRLGAIVRRERTEHGRVWWLDPSALRAPVRRPEGPGTTDAARSPKRL